jgi:hypothetical protein
MRAGPGPTGLKAAIEAAMQFAEEYPDAPRAKREEVAA